MSDLHIDDFYRDVAMIFLRLYSLFPRRSILYVDDICGPDTPDEYGLHSERFQGAFSAMVWLAQQGYISFEQTVREEALDEAVLTQKGFLLLSSRSEIDFGEARSDDGLPASVMEHSRSNVNQLRHALKSGSSIMMAQCINHLLALPPINVR